MLESVLNKVACLKRSFEYCEIFKNSFSHKTPSVAAFKKVINFPGKHQLEVFSHKSERWQHTSFGRCCFKFESMEYSSAPWLIDQRFPGMHCSFFNKRGD